MYFPILPIKRFFFFFFLILQINSFIAWCTRFCVRDFAQGFAKAMREQQKEATHQVLFSIKIVITPVARTSILQSFSAVLSGEKKIINKKGDYRDKAVEENKENP